MCMIVNCCSFNFVISLQLLYYTCIAVYFRLLHIRVVITHAPDVFY